MSIRIAAAGWHPITLWSARPAVRAVAFCAAVWVAGCGGPAFQLTESSVSVAVASNFADVQAELARRFEAATGYGVVASVGSSGQLYAQVVNGAPFEVFLSADAEWPRLLEQAGLAVAGTRSTYAEGRLALYGPRLDSVRVGGADLQGDGYTHLAIANPATAPYGAAAREVLARLGAEAVARPRLVQGENIAQAYQFVGTGAADLGFVALSQVKSEPVRSYWLVPKELHSPILQDAVLLRGAQERAAARTYLQFLRSPAARVVIESFGYDVDVEGSR
jgi:molybdate transport system substrate-binding protein